MLSVLTRDPGTRLGVTPYLRGRDRARGLTPPDSFAAARERHNDPRWTALMSDFRQRVYAEAKQRRVEVAAVEPAVGVYRGRWEPSFSVTVRGPRREANRVATALGRAYRQEAVVSFKPDSNGADREVRLRGGSDPDAFYRDLVAAFGENTGATFEGDSWRVFVGSWEKERAARIADLARKHGMRAKVRRGHGFYAETGGKDR